MNRYQDMPSEVSLPLSSVEELYENSSCGAVSFLTSGNILKINKTLLSWLGYEKEEVLHSKKIQSFFKIGGQIFFETHFFPLILLKGSIREINLEILRKDGSSLPVLLNVDQIKGERGVVTYSATIFDISERKKYERELINAKVKAEAASHYKAEFLAAMSHEIRTPLSAIFGIGNLLKKTPLDAQQEEYIRLLLLTSENLMELVNNLLDMSKIEADKIQLEQKVFSLTGLTDILQQTFNVKAKEKGIDLCLEVEQNVPSALLGDPVKLNQVLINLLGNGIKFTNKGFVKLHIGVLRKDERKVVLRFQVSDTGIGIPEDKLETVFQEFSQASYDVNQVYGGTGLGLSISRKLLKLHGSELTVKSEEGKGTEFNFDIEFRLDRQQLKKEALNASETDRELFSTARILIVDDSKLNIYVLSEFLKGWNLDFEAVENGLEAVEAVQKKSFDLILMDLNLPKMNGFEASKAIRSLILPMQPAIIALTATDEGSVRAQMKLSGMDAYVPKPFRPKELLEVLSRYLKSL